MRSRRVKHIHEYLNADSPQWRAVATATVTLSPTPLAMQPTAYVRNAWAGRDFGRTHSLEVASVHDGHTWALLAEWDGVSPAGSDFPDALAIALPIRGQPVLALMGSGDAPIHYLRWSANAATPRSIVAGGIGNSSPGPELKCSAHAVAQGSRWRVVLTRPLASGGGSAPLLAGRSTRVGFAVWRGGNDERAGIKAFSIDWLDLGVDA